MSTGSDRLYRSPLPSEGVCSSGWGLAEGVRRAVKSEANAPGLDGPGLDAALERLELSPHPHRTVVGPTLVLFSAEGPLQWSPQCWGSTRVMVLLPADEGVLGFLTAGGLLAQIFVAVDRRHLATLDDPHDYWPSADDPESPACADELRTLSNLS